MASGDSGDSPSNAAIAAMEGGGGGGWQIKQIKYQILALVHPQSDENVRLRWGF